MGWMFDWGPDAPDPTEDEAAKARELFEGEVATWPDSWTANEPLGLDEE